EDRQRDDHGGDRGRGGPAAAEDLPHVGAFPGAAAETRRVRVAVRPSCTKRSATTPTAATEIPARPRTSTSRLDPASTRPPAAQAPTPAAPASAATAGSLAGQSPPPTRRWSTTSNQADPSTCASECPRPISAIRSQPSVSAAAAPIAAPPPRAVTRETIPGV